MEEQEYCEFNWTMLFIVTACSSFLFSLIIRVIDGVFPELLLVTGGIATVLSVLTLLVGVLANQSERKKKKAGYTTTDLSRD